MSTTSTVLLAVADELERQAKEKLPKIRPEERILKEWFDNGIYFRKTRFENELYICQYDFRRRKSSRMAVGRK